MNESSPLASLIKGVREGDLNMVRQLLAADNRLLTLRESSEEGWAAIHHAAADGHGAIMNFLLDAGSSPDLPSGSDEDGDGSFTPGTRPLAIAAWKNHPALANILLSRGADPNGADYFDHSAVHVAVTHKHGPFLNLLLAHGANPDLFSNRRHCDEELDWYFYGSALHVAANGNAVEATRTILAHGAKLNECWIDDRTPLFYAAARGSSEVARLLLQAGALPNARESRQCYTVCVDYTPLHYAALNGHAATVKALLEHGADKTFQDTRTKMTPLGLALQQGHADVVSLLK